MSIFSTILSKLGIGKPAAPVTPTAQPVTATDKGEKDIAPPAPAAPRPVTVAPAPATAPVAKPMPVPTPNMMPQPVKPIPTPMAEVDVVKKLDKLSAGSGLSWKVSIVDLLKLLDIDSSRESRNELAKELGCPAELMSDSAKMNTWLHKTVLRKIAENGGNIPQELLN